MNPFKVGDKIKCINNDGIRALTYGKVYVVAHAINQEKNGPYFDAVQLQGEDLVSRGYAVDRFAKCKTN